LRIKIQDSGLGLAISASYDHHRVVVPESDVRELLRPHDGDPDSAQRLEIALVIGPE
jgi:hypothetical protein